MGLFDLTMDVDRSPWRARWRSRRRRAKPTGTDKRQGVLARRPVGRYVIVSGEKEGTEKAAERIKDTVVTFTKDKVVVVDKDKKERYSAAYTLDSTKSPTTIIMTSKVEGSAGEIARELIKKRRRYTPPNLPPAHRRDPRGVQDQGEAVDVRDEEGGVRPAPGTDSPGPRETLEPRARATTDRATDVRPRGPIRPHTDRTADAGRRRGHRRHQGHFMAEKRQILLIFTLPLR